MKRITSLLAIAATAAVAIPATSAAGTDELTSNRGGQNFSVSFDIETVDGEFRRVTDFEFRGFTVQCNQGVRPELRGTKPSMRVTNNRFQGRVTDDDGRGYVDIEGEIRQGGNRVVGSLTAAGRFPPARGCNGGVDWSATSG